MNLHEYQRKEILSSFGVDVQRGIVKNLPKNSCSSPKIDRTKPEQAGMW